MRGDRQYELANYLGSVEATIKDRKTPIEVNGYVYGSSGRHSADAELRCVDRRARPGSTTIRVAVDRMLQCRELIGEREPSIQVLCSIHTNEGFEDPRANIGSAASNIDDKSMGRLGLGHGVRHREDLASTRRDEVR